MGDIDAKASQYTSRPEVFADLFNFYLYDGKQVIKKEELKKLDTVFKEVPNKRSKKKSVERYRDGLREAIIMGDDNAVYMLILGIENQTNVHYGMPVRNMLYDALGYSEQIKENADDHKKGNDLMYGPEFLSGIKKGDKLIPIITLVVYFGQEDWDGPMSLYDMLDIGDEKLYNYIQNYKLNFISPYRMSYEEMDKLKSNFRLLAKFIKCGQNKEDVKKMVIENPEYSSVDPLMAELANEVTGSEMKLTKTKEGKVNMCIAARELREEGREEAMLNIIKTALGKGKSVAEIVDFTGYDMDFVEKVEEEYFSAK